MSGYEGAGLAGFALATVTLGMLVDQGFLTPERAVDILDQSMLVLEHLGVTDDARKEAHGLLNTILQRHARDISPPQEP